MARLSAECKWGLEVVDAVVVAMDVKTASLLLDGSGVLAGLLLVGSSVLALPVDAAGSFVTVSSLEAATAEASELCL